MTPARPCSFEHDEALVDVIREVARGAAERQVFSFRFRAFVELESGVAFRARAFRIFLLDAYAGGRCHGGAP